MNDDRYNELIALIEEYGDACENFGDFQSGNNADKCDEIMRKIKEFLKNT